MSYLPLVSAVVLLALAGCSGTTADSPASPGASTPVTSATANPSGTSSSARPRTLDAAVAAEQELTRRFAARDYAGAWQLYDRSTRNSVSQEAFVAINDACVPASASGTQFVITGSSLEGDRAVVRLTLGALSTMRTMVYEGGGWFQTAGASVKAAAGKSAAEAVSQARSSRDCATSTASPSSSPSPSPTAS